MPKKQSQDGSAPTRNNPRARGDKRIARRDTAPDVRARVEELVRLTIEGKTTKEAAAAMGVSELYVRNTKQRADFREGFEEAMREQREAFRSRLEAAATGALATQLRALVQADRWRDRIDAANSILDRAGIARITKTEAKVEGVGALAELMAGACETDD